MHHPLAAVPCDDMGPSTGADSKKSLSVWALTALLFGIQAMQQPMSNEENTKATEKRVGGKDVW